MRWPRPLEIRQGGVLDALTTHVHHRGVRRARRHGRRRPDPGAAEPGTRRRAGRRQARVRSAAPDARSHHRARAVAAASGLPLPHAQLAPRSDGGRDRVRAREPRRHGLLPGARRADACAAGAQPRGQLGALRRARRVRRRARLRPRRLQRGLHGRRVRRDARRACGDVAGAGRHGRQLRRRGDALGHVAHVRGDHGAPGHGRHGRPHETARLRLRGRADPHGHVLGGAAARRGPLLPRGPRRSTRARDASISPRTPGPATTAASTSSGRTTRVTWSAAEPCGC